MTEHQEDANRNAGGWHSEMLVDLGGEKIGKLQDVYVDVENDEPQFAAVKEGSVGRRLTFVPLGGIKLGPGGPQVPVTKEQIDAAPNIEHHGEELSQADESALHHHYEPITHRPTLRAHGDWPAADPPGAASCDDPCRSSS